MMNKKIIFSMGLMFFLSYLVSLGLGKNSIDELYRFKITESIAEEGIYPGIKTWGKEAFSKFGYLQPLMATPLYLSGKALGIKSILGKRPEIVFVLLFNPLISTINCLLLFYIARKLGNDFRISFLLSLSYGWATPSWVYAKTFFSEPLQTFAVLLMFYGLVKIEQEITTKWLLVFGCGWAIAITNNYYPAILLLPLAFWLGIFLIKKSNTLYQRLRGIGLAFIFPLLSLGSLFLYNWGRYGSFWEFGYNDERGFSNPLYVGVVGLLFSSGKGIFWYVPLLWVSLFFFRTFFRQHRHIAEAITIMFFSYLFGYAGWWSWHGGWCWGPRFLVPLLPLLILPMGEFFRKEKDFFWGAIILGISFVVQLSAVSVHYSFSQPTLFKPSSMTETMAYFIPKFSPIINHWSYLFKAEKDFFWFALLVKPYCYFFAFGLVLLFFFWALKLYQSFLKPDK